MKKMKKSLAQTILILTISLGFPSVIQPLSLPAGTVSQSREASIAKVSQLLQESGYPYRKTGESTWVIERTSPNGSRPQILLATGPDFVVVGIIVALKKDMKASPDLYFKLLKLNHSSDYVKFGFDDDDDLFVRMEIRIRQIDIQDFKSMVEDVSSNADRVLTELKPFLASM